MKLTLNDGSAPTEETLDAPPSERSSYYYMCLAFCDEAEASDAAKPTDRGMPWTYTTKPAPADAVRNMALVDAVYTAAGLAPRRSTVELPLPATLPPRL